MSTLRILLADSHGTITGKDQNSPNLGLLYLAAYVRKHQLPVEFKYNSMARTEQEHLECIAEWRPDIYAVSLTSFTAPRTYALINRIKEQYPDVLAICGGAHPTSAWQDVLLKSAVDAVCIGEGETTFLAFVQQVLAGNRTDFSQIAGLALRGAQGPYLTANRDPVANLDDIPFPARDLVNDAEFCGLTYRKATPNTGMSITRGCPFRCTFCATQYRYQSGPLYRTRSPENIAQEAEQLYQAGYREIYLYADEVNLSTRWTVAVLEALANLGHRDLYFQCHFRCDPVNEEIVKALKRANVWLVHIGIESANDRVLTGIRKQMSREKTIRACQMLTEGGVQVFAFLMLFNIWEEDGQLQFETEEEVNHTIRFAYQLMLRRVLHYCTWAYAIPVQGAELYDIALRHGIIDSNYYPADTWKSYEHIPGLTAARFNRLYTRARRQQGIMAALSGNIEWRNWRAIRHKLRTAIFGNRQLR